MTRLFRRVLAVALPLALAACSDSTAPKVPRIEETTFAPSLGVDLAAMTKTASGLYLRDLTVGTGELATAGRTATVNYVLWLPDGTKVDETTAEKGPFTFTLGAQRVIAGFDEGVTGMRVGGKRQLVIPPALGYGAQGYGPIPANAILVYTVEVIALQ